MWRRQFQHSANRAMHTRPFSETVWRRQSFNTPHSNAHTSSLEFHVETAVSTQRKQSNAHRFPYDNDYYCEIMKRARLAFNDFYVQWRYHGLFEQPHIKKYDKHKYSRSVVFWRGTPAYWPSFAIQHFVCISSLSRSCVSEAVMASAV